MRRFSIALGSALLVFLSEVPVSQAGTPVAPLMAFKDCQHCPEMIALAPGSYLMGAGPGDHKLADSYTIASELPQHNVTIAYPFAMSKYEVTVAEWGAYEAESGAKTGGECQLRLAERGPQRGKFTGTIKNGAERYAGLVTVLDANYLTPGATVSDRHPATCISRAEARGYLDWLANKTGKAYRLPSESEWEYAARAGSTTPFYFGSSRKELCAHGNFADRASPYNASAAAQCNESPSPVGPSVVGTYKANAWGLYYMAGNVFEFTSDCASENYKDAPSDGSPYLVPGCQYFVQRSYTFESMDTLLRSASRCAVGEDAFRSNLLGLRVALDLSKTPGEKADVSPAGSPAAGAGIAASLIKALR